MMIEREQVIQEFQELTRLRSATHYERRLAEALKIRLVGLGLKAVEDRAGEAIEP
jgi:tripeptide aminopeptidase